MSDFPARPLLRCVSRFLVVPGWLLGIVSATMLNAQSASPRGDAVITFTCVTDSEGTLRIDTLPKVTPRKAAVVADVTLAKKLDEAFADPVDSWRTPSRSGVPGPLKEWLSKKIIKAGFDAPGINTSKTGATSQWNISATLSTPLYTGVLVVVNTSAIPEGSPPIVEPSSELTGPLSPLWQNSSIQIIGKRTAPLSSTTGRDFVTVLKDIAARTLAASCAAYTNSQELITYTSEIQTAVSRIVSDKLGKFYAARVSFSPDLSTPGRSLLVVTIEDINPIVSTRAIVTHIQMPADKGGRMSIKDFDAKFGEKPLGPKVHEGVSHCQSRVQHELATLLPPKAFPRFMSVDERSEIADKLARLPGVSLATHRQDEGSDELTFEVTYAPSRGAITASLNADSTRELTGSLSLNYGWQNGPQLSASGTFGLTSTAVSASVGTSAHQLGGGWSATTDVEYSDQRNNDVRLGTRDGPLVTVSDTDAGGRFVLNYDSMPATDSGSANSTQKHRFRSESSLYVHHRRLAGYGTSAFLGTPRSLTGPALTLGQTLSVENLVTVPDKAPLPRWGKRMLIASTEITHWLAEDHPDYAIVRAEASLRQDFGGFTSADSYVQLRTATGIADQAAPRIDFFRLGADNGLAGLDEGELAGRSFATVSFEAGHSLGALLRRNAAGTSAPSDAAPSPLDGFYVFALVEYGCVDRQDDAGGGFNPHTSATSYALGGRLSNGVPGLGADASISFGYAWSPESIRESGRFFTSISIPFRN